MRLPWGVAPKMPLKCPGSLADNGLEVGTTPDPGLVYSVRAGGGTVTLRVNAPGTAIVVR